MRTAFAVAAIVLSGCATGTSPSQPTGSSDVVLLEDFSSRQVFPASNWWNVDISAAPDRSAVAEHHRLISGRTPQNPTATRAMHPTRSTALRHSVRRSRVGAESRRRDLRALRKPERRWRARKASGLRDPGGRAHPGEFHRGWNAGGWHERRSPSSDHRSRSLDPLRDVGDAMERISRTLGGWVGARSTWRAMHGARTDGRRRMPPGSRSFQGW